MYPPEVTAAGTKTYQQLFGSEEEPQLEGLRVFTIQHLFAAIWSRTELSMRHRSMITMALLAAQGRESELKEHIGGALHIGISQTEILEIMYHVAHYGGWAAGHRGEAWANEVFGKSQGDTRKEQEPFRQLAALNTEMGEKEKAGDVEYFRQCLSENLIFRRADGSVVGKNSFLKGLEKVQENPYLQLDVSVENVTVNQANVDNGGVESAVVDVVIIAQRANQLRPGVYRNIRMFEKKQDTWKLASWINTKLKDL